MSDPNEFWLCPICGNEFTKPPCPTCGANDETLDVLSEFYPEDFEGDCEEGYHDWVDISGDDQGCYECRRCGLIDC